VAGAAVGEIRLQALNPMAMSRRKYREGEGVKN
jgi:hypothetical protein